MFANERDSAPVTSILFIKLAEQGSTVLAYDAIRAAVSRVGRDNVYFLVFEENRFIVDLLDLTPSQNVLAIQTRSGWTTIVSGLRLTWRLRQTRISASIDLEFFSRASAVIAYLAGARRRVGFNAGPEEGPYRGDLLTHRVRYNPHLHTAVSFASLVAALDTNPRLLPAFDHRGAVPGRLPLFLPSRPETISVKQLLHAISVPEDTRLILLNANCSDLLPLRQWPRENYVALACAVLDAFPGVHLVCTGGLSEAEQIDALAREVGSERCVSIAGRTTLRELLVLYSLAEILVTNDSGPAHFAALTPIDAVVLFGPETPALFAALNPRFHPLWARLVCSPCVSALNNRQTACRDNICMQRITVDVVFEKVAQIYRRRVSEGVADRAK